MRRALPDDLAANTVEVDAPGFDPARLQRSFYTSSSCGVCGKGALEAVAVEAPRVESELRLALASRRRRCPSGCGRRRRRSRPRAACTRPGSSPPTASRCACARTSAGTTRWTRSSAGRSATACCRSPSTCSASAAGCRSSSCRRRRLRAARCSSRSARPRASRSTLAADRGITLCGFVRGGSRQRLHGAVADRELTGVLLVGGASSRFGSPKALARSRGRRSRSGRGACSARLCEERIAVGKQRRLDLPFPVLDDGTEERRPIAGDRRRLARSDARRRDRPPGRHAAPHARRACVCSPARAATPRCRRPGRFPARYRAQRAARVRERLAERRLRTVLGRPRHREVALDERLLANVNTPADLDTLAP